MKLSSLRYFITVAKYQSYTKASEYLFVSQPTLSRTIIELEEELGTKLFNREKNNLNMTEDGEILYREAMEILERCDRLQGMFREEDVSGRKALIKVGYQTDINIQHIYPVLNAFMKENPGSSILTEHASTDVLEDGLRNSRYDMIVLLDHKSLHEVEDISAVSIGHSILQVVVPEDSELAPLNGIGLMDLENYDFILLNRKMSPQVVDRLIARCVMNGFSPHVSIYVDNLTQALENAGIGMGISFIHSCMRTEWMENYFHVKIADLKDDVYESDVMLARRSGNNGRYIEKLADMLCNRQ